MGVWVFCFFGEWYSLLATQIEEIIRIYNIFHEDLSMTSQVWLIRKSFALKAQPLKDFLWWAISNTHRRLHIPLWFV
jgi:hypothetical protein